MLRCHRRSRRGRWHLFREMSRNEVQDQLEHAVLEGGPRLVGPEEEKELGDLPEDGIEHRASLEARERIVAAGVGCERLCEQVADVRKLLRDRQRLTRAMRREEMAPNGRRADMQLGRARRMDNSRTYRGIVQRKLPDRDRGELHL
jgi:hypothetical protein